MRRQEAGATLIEPFDEIGPLFEQTEVDRALASRMDDGSFESLILRGLIDE